MLVNLVIIRSLILILYFVIFVLMVISQGICVISTTRWEDVSTPAPKTYSDCYKDGYNDGYGDGINGRYRRVYARQKRDYGASSSTTAHPMISRCDSELRIPLIIWHNTNPGQYVILILLVIMFISAISPLRGALSGKKYMGCARPFCCVLSFALSGGEAAISIQTPARLEDTIWSHGTLVGSPYDPYARAQAYVESWMVASYLFFVVFILHVVDYFSERDPGFKCCGDDPIEDQGLQQYLNTAKQEQKAQIPVGTPVAPQGQIGPQPKTGIEQPPMIGQPPVSTTNQPQIVVTPQQQPSTSSMDNKSKIDPSIPKSDSERSKKGSNGSLRPKSQQPTAGTNPIAKMV